jgi:diacylglycerol kinase family enzyme
VTHPGAGSGPVGPGAGPVLVNPGASAHRGRHHDAAGELRRLLPGGEVEVCLPGEMAERARTAVSEGASFVGVAGGDGSIRTVAEVLAGSAVPLLVVPAGTRNHFARDLGLPDLGASARALLAGRVREVDLGEVNGRCFVNLSSVGIYARLVAKREGWCRRGLPKGVAVMLASVEELVATDSIPVVMGGKELWAWMVFVGNNHYGERPVALARRRCLDQGVLDLRVVRAEDRMSRLRLIAALTSGRIARSGVVEEQVVEAVEVGLEAESEVTLDGEAVGLEPPLRYRSRPRALRVLVPA